MFSVAFSVAIPPTLIHRNPDLDFPRPSDSSTRAFQVTRFSQTRHTSNAFSVKLKNGLLSQRRRLENVVRETWESISPPTKPDRYVHSRRPSQPAWDATTVYRPATLWMLMSLNDMFFHSEDVFYLRSLEDTAYVSLRDLNYRVDDRLDARSSNDEPLNIRSIMALVETNLVNLQPSSGSESRDIASSLDSESLDGTTVPS
ncbi:hypothetical protein D9613_008589 [Agrocybe pediades]|uniref:Uncharacterized protein n=1 Tax=Agrocybe pediades TaxID=84607 RepID=A0A8H4QTH1_9AGAR|nr:hypothetical protein D9613_008589 [Agrocybe pediades]